MSGTNGRFRTPRHIIQMIVGLVNPRPGQRICDPACGTAGFLIAAFNHILCQNTSKASRARGARTAVINIVDDAPDGPRQIRVEGIGTRPVIKVRPSGQDN